MKELIRLDIDIILLCEMHLPDDGDFLFDDTRVIHTHGKNNQSGVEIVLNKKWGTIFMIFVIYSNQLGNYKNVHANVKSRGWRCRRIICKH